MSETKRPSNWIRTQSSKDLVNEIEVSSNMSAPLNIVTDGLNEDRGIYAVKELVYAYAMWISPSFNLQVIRTINRDGEAWFAASDVAKALGYSNPLKAIRVHCKGVNEMDTPTTGGLQTIKIIPERDVYRLVMRSKLPSAEQFEEKVVGEILPSIRKTGGYMVSISNETPEQILSRSSSFNN